MRSMSFLCIFLLTISAARADWIDSFAGGNRQQTWNFGSLPGGSSFTDSTQAGQLTISAPTEVNLGGAAAVFGFVAQSFSDVTVRGRMNPGGVNNLNDNIGLVARLDAGTASAYVLTMEYGSNGANASLDLNVSIGGNLTALGPGPGSFAFTNTNSYFLELTAFGNIITGSVYDGTTNALLTSITGTNNALASGFSGIVAQRAATNVDPLLGTYGQMSSITAVPEPTSMLLCGTVAVAGMLIQRKRKRNSNRNPVH